MTISHLRHLRSDVLKHTTMSKLVDQLILHEGLRLKPYRCTANKLTIGIGRNYEDNPLSTAEQVALFGKTMSREEVNAAFAKGITKNQANVLLFYNIAKSTEDARKVVPNFDNLSEQRKFVMIDMAFNMGRRSLASFKNTLRLIGEGRYAEASSNMLKSKWATQVKGRARRLAVMMRDNLYFDQVTKAMMDGIR